MNKFRLYIFICAMLVGITMSAQCGNWSIRLLGGISPAYNQWDKKPDWHIGASAEYNYKLSSWFSISPSLDLRYVRSHSSDIAVAIVNPFDEFGNLIILPHIPSDNGDHYNAFDLRLNGIGNLNLPKGWAISTGPAIGICAPFSCYNCYDERMSTPKTKFRAFWAAGISKQFGRVRLGAMWYQHINDSNVGGAQFFEYFNNDLTFSIAYSL
ncbi:MAG: hypothetical protein K2I69_05045 [Muribaculaceae bacterium]|nr:hypothetical protein [Muribaculaceae bacterium]